MSYRFRGMPVAAEVNVLQREVGGDQHFMTGWNAQDGGVIPDSERDSSGAGLAGKLANPPDERLFRGWHDCSHYTGRQATGRILVFCGSPCGGRSVQGSRIANTL